MKKFSWERLIFVLTFFFCIILIILVTFMSFQVSRLNDAVINNQPVPPISIEEKEEEVVASPSAEEVEEVEEVEEATPTAKPVKKKAVEEVEE